MRDTTAHEERMWEYYKAIETENHHLKNQLVNKNKELRALKHAYNALN